MSEQAKTVGAVVLAAWVFTITVGTLCWFTGGGATVWVGGGIASAVITAISVIALAATESDSGDEPS
jgi:hypothetical protein